MTGNGPRVAALQAMTGNGPRVAALQRPAIEHHAQGENLACAWSLEEPAVGRGGLSGAGTIDRGNKFRSVTGTPFAHHVRSPPTQPTRTAACFFVAREDADAATSAISELGIDDQ